MHEQRGNFNGIDTCSVTQFRNFKLISYLLQENESRSLIGRPDINALLDKFVKEKIMSHQFANNYRDTAKLQTSNIDFNDLCYGATFVPSKQAIEMQQIENFVSVKWDDISNENISDTDPIV